MSTPSMIYMKTENGYQGVSCHTDGEVIWNGFILQTFYQTQTKVSQLIGLGDLVSLGVRLGHKVDFNRQIRNPDYYNQTSLQCVAYCRDKDEDFCCYTCNSINDARISQYTYVFQDNEWYLLRADGSLDLLRNVLPVAMAELSLERQRAYVALAQNMTPDEQRVFLPAISRYICKDVVIPPVLDADYLVTEQVGECFKTTVLLNLSHVSLTRNDIDALQSEGCKVVVKQDDSYVDFSDKVSIPRTNYI